MKAISVIKISGHCLDDAALLRQFARTVARSSEPVVIVHGGGIEITRLQEKLDIKPRYEEGLRVTDAESLALVEMVLCGSVNKRLTRVLLAAGVDALGLSGIDRGLVQARKMRHERLDMQFTGEVQRVRGQVLLDLLEMGVTPVVAPVSLGDGSSLNLNADPVAGAIAAAIKARRVVFISNVAGVLIDGQLAAEMTREQAEDFIARGAISGGMIPKVRSALDVLSSGLPQAIITDLKGYASGGGTSFADATATDMDSEGQ